MKVWKYNKLLLGFIILGLIAALVIGVQRHRVEQASRQVDLAIDYEGLLELAEREGLPAEQVLKELEA